MTVIPPCRWFAPSFVVIGLAVLGLCAQQISVNETSIKRFTEWCEERSDLPSATQHKVDQLLTIAGTQDWAEADALISQEDTLMLERLERQDLRSLAEFTQVPWLSLSMNQIEAIDPVEPATQLIYL